MEKKLYYMTLWSLFPNLFLMSSFIELLKNNANRCIALVVAEIVVISWFHYIEWSLFLNSELLALGIHFLLSLFWLCFYVIMRSKFSLSKHKRYSPYRIIWESILYTVFDFLLIHATIGRILGEFEFHAEELGVILLFVYAINLYFDTHAHKCCHDHCG